jgi:5'-3' exonuclease
MKLLIDGDILVYRAGFAAEKIEIGEDGEKLLRVEPVENALHNVDKSMYKLLMALKATSYEVFLTATADDTNFRLKIDPNYKKNRIRQRKPIYYHQVREHLFNKWDAQIVKGAEADDALGVAQVNATEETVICSIDKDLNMIPGNHYNIAKDFFYTIDPWEARFMFYSQILTGDRVDNIPGLTGIGPIKANKILQDCETETHLYRCCLGAYQNQEYRMIQTGRLLHISQQELGELWEPGKDFSMS